MGGKVCVAIAETQCDYCGHSEVNRLMQGTSVNIIGTKEKGKVFKISDEIVKVIIIDLAKNKIVREYKAPQLKKIL
jgi:hypothetical protein